MSGTTSLTTQKKASPAQARTAARFAMSVRIVVAAMAIVGVAIESVFAGLPQGNFNFLSYYTIQSNLIIAVAFLLSAARMQQALPPWRSLAMIERSARLWIYMAGLGYLFLLSSLWHPPGIRGVANVLLHYGVPIGAFASWLLCEPKGSHRLRELWVWVSYPSLYMGGSLIRGYFDGFYPYWFLDPKKAAPAGGASLWIGLLLAGLIATGLLVTGLDAFLARRARKGTLSNRPGPG